MSMRENFEDGKIKLKWLGQMGFLIMTQDTTVCGLFCITHRGTIKKNADPGEFADYLDAKYGSKVHCIIPNTLEDIVLPG